MKSNEEDKDQESIQSSTTHDPVHHLGKCLNTRKHYIPYGKEVSFFPAGQHKPARNRQDSMTDKNETQITKKIHKRSITLE